MDGPFCSIVIATHRRPDALARCVAALAQLEYPAARLEVVVVDDGGGVPLETTLGPFRESLRIRLVEQEQRGPGAARNTGAAHAHGELLAFTDDDCRPERSWLSHLASALTGSSFAAVGGHTINELHDNPYAAASQLVIDVAYAQNNMTPDDARFFTSNNLVVDAEMFRTLGGFDDSFTTSEDRDLCERWVRGGLRLAYVPHATVLHAHDLTFAGFVRQHFAYGRGLHRFHRAHGRSAGGRASLDPSSFYARLLGRVARVRPRRRAIQLTLLLQLWNIVNIAGFTVEAVASRRRRERRPVSRALPPIEPVDVRDRVAP